ncbi:MAG: hypothetical protein ACI9XR_000069 [Flavobacterium sp.]|jgi:uncharacterized protein (DUF1697 family)
MVTHLVLLRGINVSGTKMIKMESLKKSLEEIGYTNLKTYIQSGNVFIDSEEENSNKIAFDTKQQIFKTFGFDVPCIVLAKSDLEKCLTNNPFLKEKDCNTKKLYVAFTSKLLTDQSIHDLKISAIKPDEVAIEENRMYIKYFDSPAKTRLDTNYIEKKLVLNATIRNWNTINKLLEMFVS